MPGLKKENSLRGNSLTARGSEQCPGPLKVGGSIDTDRHGVNERDIDAHARFQRPQLLKFLSALQFRAWQRYKPLQRRAAESVNADMVI